MDIQGFIKKYQGQFVTDLLGTYRGQCVSLVKRWLQWNKWPARRGNAIQWQYHGDNKNYKYIRNTATTLPKTGDLAIFNVGKYGHIGIVVSATLKTMRVFNQNYPIGKPAVITTFDYLKPKCVGFLRKI